MSAFAASSSRISAESRSPYTILTLGNWLTSCVAFSLFLAKAENSQSGWAWYRTKSPSPPMYPVVPVLDMVSVISFLES